jgi:hypothetical protein
LGTSLGIREAHNANGKPMTKIRNARNVPPTASSPETIGPAMATIVTPVMLIPMARVRARPSNVSPMRTMPIPRIPEVPMP